MTVLIFPTARHMLRLLVLWNQKHSAAPLLPRQAFPVQGMAGYWALEVRQADSTTAQQVAGLLAMGGVIREEVAAQSLGKAVPLPNLVHHLLERVNPSSCALKVPLPRYYILGCRSEATAAKVGTALFSAKNTGTRLLPVMDNRSGFSHFWFVENRPRLGSLDDDARHGPPGWEAMQLASRVWWGIERGGWEADPLYLEYPWLPIGNIDETARLLGQDGVEPRQLCLVSADAKGVIHIEASLKTVPDLTEVLPLERPENIFEPALLPSSQQLSRLKLRLSLGRRSNRSRLERVKPLLEARRKALEEELRAVSHVIEGPRPKSFAGETGGPEVRSETQATGNRQDANAAPEELYVHQLHVHFGGEEPYPPPRLQSLLLEMMHAPEELQNVFCARLDLRDPERDGTPRPAYVVAAGAALGQQPLEKSTLSIRLEEYRPVNSPSDGRSYEMLTEWALLGLYLFVPVGRSLELWPNISPSALAAERIGARLLGDWRAVIGLLEEGPGSTIEVTIIAKDQFQPFTDTLKLDLDGVAPAPFAAGARPALAEPHLTATLADRMADAYLPAARNEWNKVHESIGSMRQQMQAAATKVQALRARLDDASRRSDAVARELSAGERLERTLVREIEQAIAALELPRTQAALSGLSAAEARLSSARTRLNAAMKPPSPPES